MSSNNDIGEGRFDESNSTTAWQGSIDPSITHDPTLCERARQRFAQFGPNDRWVKAHLKRCAECRQHLNQVQ